MRKPEGPEDVDRSTGHRGSSAGTLGLNALDEEREASVADEGGASGAVVESQDVTHHDRPVAHPRPVGSRRGRPGFWVLAGAVAAGALGALALRKRR